MSVFGESRPQTPETISELEPPPIIQSLAQSPINKEVINAQHSADDTTSIASSEATSTAQPTAKKELQRLRRWYYHELNLVDAFETAASNDLAHNLLGFALEKRSPFTTAEAQKSYEWTSKSRWNDDNDAETLRRSHAWAAWPCPLSELPDDVSGFSNWQADRDYGSSYAGRKRRRIGHDLDDSLSSIGLELAREQADANSKRIRPHVQDVTRKDRLEADTDDGQAKFGVDEEASSKLLRPALEETVQKMDQLFSVLKPVKHPMKEQNDLLEWSDVLNLAAGLGWDGPALANARARCTSMFGEQDMSSALSLRSKRRNSKTRNSKDVQKNIVYQTMREATSADYQI